MSEGISRGRIHFHETLNVMEVDFSKLEFSSASQIDEFYDEVDRSLATSSKRWYFMVNYSDCVIREQLWDHFAQRGKQSNITYGLGTVRFGATEEIRSAIRERSVDGRFRSSLYESRDEALVALSEMRKRHKSADGDKAESFFQANDIHLNFGGVKALQGVGFSVHQGEIFSIIGPNGAGKTSMLNVINGFYQPSRGSIIFSGKDCTKLSPHKVAELGFARTFQNIALFKGMSTLDNLMTGRLLKMRYNFLSDAIYWGVAQKEEMRHREQVEKIIDFLEIEAIRKTPVGRLPYGLQKRVELGRALAMEPKLLLLDEPMAGMNVEEKEDMARFILDVNDEWGTTIILIEHDMGVVMDLSSLVVVLDHGEKISEGTPNEIRTDPVVIRAYLGEG